MAKEPLSLFRKRFGTASLPGLCCCAMSASLRAQGWAPALCLSCLLTLILPAAVLPVPHLLRHHPLPVEPSSFPVNNFLSAGLVAVCRLCRAAAARVTASLRGCELPASLGVNQAIADQGSGIGPLGPCSDLAPVPEAWRHGNLRLRFAEGGSVTFLACWVITFPAWRWERVCFTCCGR